MPLKLTLRPNEKVLVGTAVIANGPAKAEIVVLNRVPVLRQKDIIAEDEADTPAKQLYVAILHMYVEPAEERRYHKLYFHLLRQLIEMTVDVKIIDLMVDVSRRIVEGDHYRALKLCRKLIQYESEVSSNGERADQRLPADAEIESDPA
ncbi:flagellar biosynthesis repressor FlbT [Insolitispirillum peregrinum]|uniref:Flagellar protein FlbT n=1 Tax=Insolitispirillum peregrinum TaxID=80876 RepID=A0A1N7IIT4_9PROT|nr:flagellar biosynthesis repressor FlbT [Insolitispirillum peregrinum]SIS36995.1 flagellar protein FlbT [Insolitispirillum peregrinum]